MSRVYKTQKNLIDVWKMLDNASGALYEAAGNLEGMTGIPDIQKALERVDITAVDSLKEQIEELIQDKNQLI